MANKERGEMRLVAGDQTYTLKLTVNAQCDLEDRSGKVLGELIDQINKGSSTALRWVIWGSMQEYHADVVKHPKDAGRIMQEAGGVGGIQEQMAKFMALNMEDAQKDEGKDSKNPREAQDVPIGEDSTSPVAVMA